MNVISEYRQICLNNLFKKDIVKVKNALTPTNMLKIKDYGEVRAKDLLVSSIITGHYIRAVYAGQLTSDIRYVFEFQLDSENVRYASFICGNVYVRENIVGSTPHRISIEEYDSTTPRTINCVTTTLALHIDSAHQYDLDKKLYAYIKIKKRNDDYLSLLIKEAKETYGQYTTSGM